MYVDVYVPPQVKHHVLEVKTHELPIYMSV